jgi:hypothetical protein
MKKINKNNCQCQRINSRFARENKKGQMRIKDSHQRQKISGEIFSLHFSKSRKAQMTISFGMIFSIILIIIFISFAFFAIKKFLTLGDTAQIAKFANSLKTDIDKAWKGTQSSQEKEYSLPSKIKFVCFADYANYPGGGNGIYESYYSELKQLHQEFENIFFYPIGSSEGLNSKEIKHLDIEKMTAKNNPYCIENQKGKIKIVIEKKYGEALVTIK